MEGWMEGWMDGCMDAWMHGCKDACMHGGRKGCMDGLWVMIRGTVGVRDCVVSEYAKSKSKHLRRVGCFDFSTTRRGKIFDVNWTWLSNRPLNSSLAVMVTKTQRRLDFFLAARAALPVEGCALRTLAVAAPSSSTCVRSDFAALCSKPQELTAAQTETVQMPGAADS